MRDAGRAIGAALILIGDFPEGGFVESDSCLAGRFPPRISPSVDNRSRSR